MKAYRVVCQETGNGWIVNCDSEKRAKELILENYEIYEGNDITFLNSWELFIDSNIEEVVED